MKKVKHCGVNVSINFKDETYTFELLATGIGNKVVSLPSDEINPSMLATLGIDPEEFTVGLAEALKMEHNGMHFGTGGSFMWTYDVEERKNRATHAT